MFGFLLSLSMIRKKIKYTDEKVGRNDDNRSKDLSSFGSMPTKIGLENKKKLRGFE